MTASLRLPVAFLAVLISATACRPDASDVSRGPAVRDSAGIRIVENGSPALAPDLLVSPTPKVQVPRSSLAERAGARLSQVRDVALLSDGRVLVANGATNELRFYDSEGRYLDGQYGRGDLDSFASVAKLMVFPGDTLMIQDSHDRLWLDGSGGFARRDLFNQGAFGALWNRRVNASGEWLGDGTFLMTQNLPVRTRSPGLRRDSVVLVRLARGFVSADTLGVYPGLEQETVDPGDGQTLSLAPPSAKSTTWSTGALDGTVVVGDNANPEIQLHHPDGRLTVARWVADSERATPEEVADFRRRILSAQSGENTARVEQALDRMTLPEHKAFYYRVHIAVDGSPWVRLGTWWSDPTEYVVFDPTGAMTGWVAFPGRFTVFEAGPGYAMGVLHGDDGSETVQLFELVR